MTGDAMRTHGVRTEDDHSWSIRCNIRRIRAMKSSVKIKRGTGNVFEDLGFSPGDTENLQLRAQLMSKIRAETRDMTQAQAATLFSVTQPRINDLLRGKIDKFSLDALVNMLAAAGLRVEMRLKQVA